MLIALLVPLTEESSQRVVSHVHTTQEEQGKSGNVLNITYNSWFRDSFQMPPMKKKNPLFSVSIWVGKWENQLKTMDYIVFWNRLVIYMLPRVHRESLMGTHIGVYAVILKIYLLSICTFNMYSLIIYLSIHKLLPFH